MWLNDSPSLTGKLVVLLFAMIMVCGCATYAERTESRQRDVKEYSLSVESETFASYDNTLSIDVLLQVRYGKVSETRRHVTQGAGLSHEVSGWIKGGSFYMPWEASGPTEWTPKLPAQGVDMKVDLPSGLTLKRSPKLTDHNGRTSIQVTLAGSNPFIFMAAIPISQHGIRFPDYVNGTVKPELSQPTVRVSVHNQEVATLSVKLCNVRPAVDEIVRRVDNDFRNRFQRLSFEVVNAITRLGIVGAEVALSNGPSARDVDAVRRATLTDIFADRQHLKYALDRLPPLPEFVTEGRSVRTTAQNGACGFLVYAHRPHTYDLLVRREGYRFFEHSLRVQDVSRKVQVQMDDAGTRHRIEILR